MDREKMDQEKMDRVSNDESGNTFQDIRTPAGLGPGQRIDAFAKIVATGLLRAMKERQNPETSPDSAPNCDPSRKPAGITTQTKIRTIKPVETLPLRCEVLRPRCSVRESVFAGDDDAATEHWGFSVGDTLIAVASLYQEPLPEPTLLEPVISLADDDTQSEDCWRLRGMAVSLAFQGQGYGRQLLDRCLESVAGHGGSLLWCNARTSAVEFYQEAGFQTVGGEFDIPGIGPHYVMVRAIYPHEDRHAT